MSETLPLTEHERQGVVVASGSVNPELAADIAETMGIELSPMDLDPFSDSEVFARFKENVRKKEVIVIQAVAQRGNFSASDAMMELCLMLQAAKLAHAKEITALISYFGFGRQDRKAASRTPISGKLVSQFYDIAGADVIMTPDIHSQQAQAFSDKKFDLLTVIPEVRRKVREDVMAARSGEYVVAALDAGAAKRAEMCAHDLDVDWVQFTKSRSKTEHDTIDRVEAPAAVKGKTVIAFEDVIATGMSAIRSAEAAKHQGAEAFYVAAAHAQFSGDGLIKSKGSEVNRFYFSNTLPTAHITQELQDQACMVPVGHILGQAALKALRGESLSEMFHGQHLM